MKRQLSFGQGLKELGINSCAGPAQGVAFLRKNTNGYPYITFDKTNESDNIYFSKDSAPLLEELDLVKEEDGKEVIKLADVNEHFGFGLIDYKENNPEDEREEQWKLIKRSNRVSLAEFLEA